MEQKDFNKELVHIVYENALIPNAKQMAQMVYFHMKQNPDNVEDLGKATAMLIVIKEMLVYFQWDIKEIHTFILEMKNLTKYMKKST